MPVPTFMNSVPVSHPGASTGPHRGSPPKASSPPKPGSPPKVNGHAVNGVKPAVVPAGVPTAAGAAAAAAARAEALAASAKSRPPHRRRRVSKDMQRLLKPKKSTPQRHFAFESGWNRRCSHRMRSCAGAVR